MHVKLLQLHLTFCDPETLSKKRLGKKKKNKQTCPQENKEGCLTNVVKWEKKNFLGMNNLGAHKRWIWNLKIYNKSVA